MSFAEVPHGHSRTADRGSLHCARLQNLRWLETQQTIRSADEQNAHFHKSFTSLSQVFHKSFTSLSQVFHKSFTSLSQVFHKSFTSLSQVFHKSFTSLSQVFHKSFTSLSQVFHKSFTSLSQVFHKSFTSLSQVFHKSFTPVWMNTLSSPKSLVGLTHARGTETERKLPRRLTSSVIQQRFPCSEKLRQIPLWFVSVCHLFNGDARQSLPASLRVLAEDHKGDAATRHTVLRRLRSTSLLGFQESHRTSNIGDQKLLETELPRLQRFSVLCPRNESFDEASCLEQNGCHSAA